MAAVVLLVSASLACGDDSATGSGGNYPQVTVGDNYFAPNSVTIAPGDTVAWIWGGAAGHNVIFTAVPGTPPADCGVMSSGICFRVFGTVKGTYNYVCSLHAGMNGNVIIQ